MKLHKQIMSGTTAASYGCIATFENADGLVMTRHATGNPIAACRRLCDHAESIDPTYRLVSYSTPTSVYGDFVGRGIRHNLKGEMIRFPSGEKRACAKAGRPHMIHERCGA